MSDFQYVKLSSEDGIVTMVISNPPVNALSTTVITDLKTAFERVSADPATKAIIITGAGTMFVAGADIKEIDTISSADRGKTFSRKGQEFFTQLQYSPIPVIAAINGACLGGGNELAMACHIRIASERARFGQPEINLGVCPGFGGTQRLPRMVGTGKAIELLITGDMISAQEAKAIGLVNMVVPEDQLMKQAQELAKKIASKSKVAVGTILKAVTEGMKVSQNEGMYIEAEAFGKICETEDKKEGVRAFLEKRQPKFQNR